MAEYRKTRTIPQPLRDYRNVKLEELSDEEFNFLVDRELRKDHSHTPLRERDQFNALLPKLRHPAVIDRWLTVLEMMKASAESQIAAKRADVKKLHGRVPLEEYENKLREFESWKAGNVRFLNSVQQRLFEARQYKRRRFGNMFPVRLTEERNAASNAYLDLVKAIEKHRETVLAEYDPTGADEVLWASIEETVKEHYDDDDLPQARSG